MDVHPTPEFLDFVRAKVASGEYPSEEAVWLEAMRRFQGAEGVSPMSSESTDTSDPVDLDAIAYCAREIEGHDLPSLEDVRRILTKVSGSMADAVAEARAERA